MQMFPNKQDPSINIKWGILLSNYIHIYLLMHTHPYINIYLHLHISISIKTSFLSPSLRLWHNFCLGHILLFFFCLERMSVGDGKNISEILVMRKYSASYFLSSSSKVRQMNRLPIAVSYIRATIMLITVSTLQRELGFINPLLKDENMNVLIYMKMT